jgi:3-mercaptopropionate dioxygenase
VYLGLHAGFQATTSRDERASSGTRRSFLFLSRIERAVRNDRVTELAGTLAQLDIEGAFDDPSLFDPPNPHRYARRVLWEDPNGRFCVVAITWAPGQFSPLHDHAGIWGSELVVDGVMREATFRLAGREGERYRFVRERDRLLANGDVGVVAPPLQYHEFGNAGPVRSHSIHVYAGSLRDARTYVPGDDGLWSSMPMYPTSDA